MAVDPRLGLLALTRFGHGPRADGDAAAAAADPQGFVAAELAQPGIALLSGPGLPTSQAAIAQVFVDQEQRKAARAAAAVAPPPGPDAVMMAPAVPPTDVPPAPAKPPSPEQIIFRAEALARIRRAVEARVGIAERLVAFWSNHFCVSVAKGPLGRATAGAFEREAIRPHVLGRFADMLVAVESHPAMLHYLDNAQSVGPQSPAGLRRQRGLNENLGREIMELHTVGVGGGYTQADVTSLAKILTGWTFIGRKAADGEPGTFLFRPNTHEPGPIELLGKTYPDAGVAQGRAALLDLARHPATARFIATKLASAFVADVPAPSLVDRLERVFRDTDGDLKELTSALIAAPESWASTAPKMRSPYDFLIATARLLNRLPDEPGQILGPLNALGMALWAPPAPNGFPHLSDAWTSGEGMKLRLDYVSLLVSRLRDPPNPSDLLDAMCGAAASPDTRAAIARAESRQQGLALLLMSPEMQRS